MQRLQEGKTPVDLAKDYETRKVLRSAPAAAVTTAFTADGELALLLSQHSLGAHGTALCDKLGVTCVADLLLLNENDLEKNVPAMTVVERRRLLSVAVRQIAQPDLRLVVAPTSKPPTSAAFQLHAALGALDISSLAAISQQLGILSTCIDDDSLRVKLEDALSDAAASAASLEDAVIAAAVERLATFVQQFHVLHLDPAAQVAKHAGSLDKMWVELYAQFLPSKLAASPVRKETRVLVIGPGFGMIKNPAQLALLTQAGFKVKSCFPPDPEAASFNMTSAIDGVLTEMQAFKPQVVACASKGGAYVVELWRRMRAAVRQELHGWTGAAVMINAHPRCLELPPGVPVVVAHGAGDSTFPRGRAQLDALIKSGGHTSALLYYSAGGGAPARSADGHDMASIVHHDCLPRLLDAVVTLPAGCLSVSPEFNLQKSWGGFLSAERRAAEEQLGYKPDQLYDFWKTDGKQAEKLVTVEETSDEFKAVRDIFLSEPAVPAYYKPRSGWPRSARIVSIKRVENSGQEGASRTTYVNLSTTLRSTGVSLTGSVHTRWLFHGTHPDTLVRIVSDPVRGFTPLARKKDDSKITLWGEGIYFARDASYPDSFGFAEMAPNGTKAVLLCLVMTGTSCLGGNDVQLYQQMRDGYCKYDSLVDDLSNPEIFVVGDGAQVFPAYAIQYA
jgi:hypothetical protein